MKDAVTLLDETLSKEKKSDETLSKVASSAVNAGLAQIARKRLHELH